MRIYVACQYAHKDTAAKVAEALAEDGHTILCPWWAPVGDPPETEADWRWIGDKEAQAVWEADLMVVIWMGPSIGTAMELGMRRGHGSPAAIFPLPGTEAALDSCPFLYRGSVLIDRTPGRLAAMGASYEISHLIRVAVAAIVRDGFWGGTWGGSPPIPPKLMKPETLEGITGGAIQREGEVFAHPAMESKARPTKAAEELAALIEPASESIGAALAPFVALDDATPRGPWAWKHWNGDLCLVQNDRKSWGGQGEHNGWYQVLGFTTKGSGGLRRAQPVFHSPGNTTEETYTGDPMPALQGGIWLGPDGGHMGEDMHPVARWMQQGRQSFADLLSLAWALAALALGEAEERDLWKARAIEKGWVDHANQ